MMEVLRVGRSSILCLTIIFGVVLYSAISRIYALEGDKAMNLQGFFQVNQQKYQLGESIWLTLTVQNQGNLNVYMFVPRSRIDGIHIAVKNGKDFLLKDLREEADVGLVPEIELLPSQIYNQQYPLSEWLRLKQPGDYTIECAIEIESYDASLRQQEQARNASYVTISSDVQFTILPANKMEPL